MLDSYIGFVIDPFSHKTKELIQVTWDLSNPNTRNRELKSLLAANQKFKAEKLTLITHENREELLELEGNTIEIIPAWKWLLSSN